jgi:hypothetical protein
MRYEFIQRLPTALLARFFCRAPCPIIRMQSTIGGIRTSNQQRGDETRPSPFCKLAIDSETPNPLEPTHVRRH